MKEINLSYIYLQIRQTSTCVRWTDIWHIYL